MAEERFRKEITFSPAFDKRDPDPQKNYGVHGVEMRWLLHGPDGVVQFLVFTGWNLPHVTKEMDERLLAKQRPKRVLKSVKSDRPLSAKLLDELEGRGPGIEAVDLRIRRPMPADLGYHSWMPRYEGQSAMDCHLSPNGICYYDGSGLNAEPIFSVLLREGSDGVWRELEKYYASVFEVSEDA
jgi:hypothetical protein